MKCPSVFAVPGTQCDERLWRRLTPLLPSLNWHHLAIPAGNSIDALVQALLVRLPAEPVNLLGFSLGGYLAARLACVAPGRVARLMICANTPRALPPDELQQRNQLLAWIDRYGYSGLSDRKVAQMISASSLSDPGIGETMKAMDAELGEAVLVQQLRATSAREDLADALAVLPLPVHFCFGTEDRLVVREWVAGFRQRQPDCVVSEVAGAGHMLPLEAPEALAESIERWIMS